MRVLAACSLGGAGHLHPLLPLLEAARRVGHDIGVVAPPAMRAMVDDGGFTWLGGGEPPEAEVAPIREQLPILPAAEASDLGELELFGRLATGAMLPAMRSICAEWQPDLVLREPCEHASTVVAAELGLPVAQVAISTALGEWSAIRRSAPAIAEFNVEAPGLNRSMPYLTRFPASLDRSPFPTTWRYHASTASAVAAPLPDWWGGAAAPLVYVTFGTVLGHMSMAADVYRVALEAVAGLDARVLLTTGRRFDPAQLGPLPDHVHVEPWVDHDAAVAGAALVVTHGGSGTVFGTLQAGVPMVVVPVFADQFTNADLVTGAGVGLVVAPPEADGLRTVVGAGEVPAIRAAVEHVLAEPSFRAAAAALGAEMRSTPKPSDLVAALLPER